MSIRVSLVLCGGCRLHARRWLPTMSCVAPQLRTASLMRPSFAYFRSTLHAGICGLALALSACASLPPPTTELAAAQQALARAEAADAEQYAAQDIANARQALTQAQTAMADGRQEEARRGALIAAAHADLAHANSRAATTRAEFAQRQAQIAELQAQLQVESDGVASNPLDISSSVAADAADAESQRLLA